MISPRPTMKKQFESEQEAINFELQNRTKYGILKQNPYLCQECDGYHLTGLSRDSYKTTVDYQKMENFAPQRRERRSAREMSVNEEEQIFQDYETGRFSRQDLAEKYNTIVSHIWRITAPNKSVKLQPKPAPVVTIDSLSLHIDQLKTMLKAQEEELERRREAQRVKVSRLADGRIQVKKESQTFMLSDEDWAIAINEIEGLLTEPVTQTV